VNEINNLHLRENSYDGVLGISWSYGVGAAGSSPIWSQGDRVQELAGGPPSLIGSYGIGAAGPSNAMAFSNPGGPSSPESSIASTAPG
jgi:hypothetical protein